MTSPRRREFSVPLFGPRSVTTMRVAAGVLGFLFVAALVAFPITFMAAPEEDRFGLVVAILLAALVFGLPAYGAVRFIQSPPRDAIELDPTGIRRVGGRLEWNLSWWQFARYRPEYRAAGPLASAASGETGVRPC